MQTKIVEGDEVGMLEARDEGRLTAKGL